MKHLLAAWVMKLHLPIGVVSAVMIGTIFTR